MLKLLTLEHSTGFDELNVKGVKSWEHRQAKRKGGWGEKPECA